MKRFIVALSIMIGILFITMFGYPNIESALKLVDPVTKVYVYNDDMGLIRFAQTEEEIPTHIKRQMDLLCEIDGIKYYWMD